MTDASHTWLVDEDIIRVGRVLVRSSHVVISLSAASYDPHLHLPVFNSHLFVLLCTTVVDASIAGSFAAGTWVEIASRC